MSETTQNISQGQNSDTSSVYSNAWSSLLVSLTIVTQVFSQPLFSYVITNDVLDGIKDSFLLILLYQLLPISILFLVDRGICAFGTRVGIALKLYRLLLFGLVVLTLLRTMQLEGYLEFNPFTVSIIMVVLAILGYRYYRPTTFLVVFFFSISSLVLTGNFLVHLGISEANKVDTDKIQIPISPSDLPPVFIFVFDGLGEYILLKDGEMDSTRFPNFADLADESAVFTNATSNYMDSHSSINTMLNGRLVSKEKAVEDGELLRILADSGYAVEFHSNTFGCSQKYLSCQVQGLWAAQTPNAAARNFAIWYLPTSIAKPIKKLVQFVLPDDATLQLPIETIHRGDLDQWSNFLDRLMGSPTGGKAYFVHSLLSHRPYEFDRNGVRVRTLLSPGRDFETMEKDYEEQIMYLDRLLGDFINSLKQKELFERSFIAITGDHGPRTLGLRHSRNAFDEPSQFPDRLNGIIPWIPLMIHGPDVEPQINSAEYQHIDLLPTMLGLLEIHIPSDLDGISAFSLARKKRDKIFFAYPLKKGKVTYQFSTSSGEWERINYGGQ
jgi:hypothetical protein